MEDYSNLVDVMVVRTVDPIFMRATADLRSTNDRSRATLVSGFGQSFEKVVLREITSIPFTWGWVLETERQASCLFVRELFISFVAPEMRHCI
ncbi:MAG: hypothetical protein AAFX93_19385 [Verrucomicrobiota bacterium]